MCHNTLSQRETISVKEASSILKVSKNTAYKRYRQLQTKAGILPGFELSVDDFCRYTGIPRARVRPS